MATFVVNHPTKKRALPIFFFFLSSPVICLDLSAINSRWIIRKKKKMDPISFIWRQPNENSAKISFRGFSCHETIEYKFSWDYPSRSLQRCKETKLHVSRQDRFNTVPSSKTTGDRRKQFARTIAVRMNGRLFAIFRQIGYMRNSINTRVPLDFNFQSRKGIHSDFVLAAWMGET